MNPDEKKEMHLMAAFDPIDSSLHQVDSDEGARVWRPRAGEEERAFAELISQENRGALRAWFAQFSAINPSADRFRHILENAIGEALPLKEERRR